jgi:excisionase family DNA binding protein
VENELITVTEAAAILGTSRPTIHALIQRGVLTPLYLPPAYRRQGKKRYLRRVDVEAIKNSWRQRKPRKD